MKCPPNDPRELAERATAAADSDPSTAARGSQNRFMNESGQMSVFVALMFQVLFVFFAMVINIGLLVHDKINLQNAVDLGAFYGAQKQAELLEEIAHVNYQIRQDYKLLTWRYRVIGTLGRLNGNQMPAAVTPDGSAIPPDTPRPSMYPDPASTEEIPVICAAHKAWAEFGTTSNQNENYCFQSNDFTTPGIKTVPIINIFLPINGIIAGFTKNAQSLLAASCEEAAPLNWAFTVQILYAYRQAVAERKMLINAMRKNLIAADSLDLDGSSIKAGVEKTITKNLTSANAASISAQVLNGMTLGGCDANDGDFMMPEIQIAPLMKFMNTQGLGDENGCKFQTLYHTQYEKIPPASRAIWDTDGRMAQLSNGEPATNDPMHSSLGYEKNPWCMTYVGVKATSQPHKPFAPFGQPITLEARAFAQPFGGRVGPWYTSHWARGSAMSDLADEARIDKLTTPRLVPGGASITYSLANLPNYSRFPGDTVGMRSQLSQAAQRNVFNKMDRTQPDTLLSLKYFAAFSGVPQTGDPLIWNPLSPPGQPLDSYPFARFRKAELAVIAPDVFDATYYSIEPNYDANFHVKHLANPGRYQLQPLFGTQSSPIGDLGSRADNPTLKNFNVENQIAVAMAGGMDPSILPSLPYPIRNWVHLLTSWAPNAASNYDFPDSRFASCSKANDPAVPIPGKCAVGGRNGYSVRLVSREHLLFDDWSVGGDGVGPGGLMNKPPVDF